MNHVDPLINRVIASNFRIEKLIGSGAMGNVYRAEQLSLSKAVALKVLHAHLMGDDKLILRFKREAKNASLLNHPNSIQIIDSGQDSDGTLFIAMELLTGRDLAQVIRDDFPLPLPRIARIMGQTLSALDEAHARGVIHRDLKPSNVMLIERRGEADFVKVCDFGIAKATQDAKDDREAMLTIQGLVCGTPEYMAPEQARGEPLDGRADLYAAAVILYQLATGDIPFKGESPMAIVSRHLAEPPVAPSRKRPDLSIPAALDALILRGMEKNREMRFADATAFREALEAAVSGDADRAAALTAAPGGATEGARLTDAGEAVTVLAAERAPFGSTARLQRMGPRRSLAAVALAVALGAGGAMLFLRGQRTDDGDDARAPGAEAAPARAAATVAPAPPTATAPPAPAVPPPPALPATPPTPTAVPTATHAEASPARPAIHRKKGLERAAAPLPSVEPGAAPAGAPVAGARPPAAATRAGAQPTPEPGAPPAPRGGREILGEAEALLAQGEVTNACARGEEAKRASPKHAPAYKFLGKCYMRAGDTDRATQNYRRYLELYPDAPDAMFVKSIVK